MLVPHSTDAPVYYWPFATLGTCIFNFLVHLRVATLSDDHQDWVYQNFILQYGEWNPVQWVTSNYLFAGWLHLLPNLFVLWGIGIIIEGKIGWAPFLLLYNAIGVFHNGIEQTLMIFAEGFTVGPGPITMAMLGIALVWAPRNELNCILCIGWRYMDVDLYVSTYVGVCVVIELLFGYLALLLLAAMEMLPMAAGVVLHLSGLLTGFGLGLVMLKLKWVDCEDWDLFSVWQNRHTKTREELAEEALNSEEAKAKIASHFERMHEQFRGYLVAGEGPAALAVHRRGRLQFGSNWQTTEEEHVHLIAALRKVQRWDDAVQVMVEYLQTQSQRAPVVRLALAQLLVEQCSRPNQALKVLRRLDPQTLPAGQRPMYERLMERAAAEAAEDPFEATVEDW
jgi:membrane associated rhomboid family serine protease